MNFIEHEHETDARERAQEKAEREKKIARGVDSVINGLSIFYLVAGIFGLGFLTFVFVLILVS